MQSLSNLLNQLVQKKIQFMFPGHHDLMTADKIDKEVVCDFVLGQYPDYHSNKLISIPDVITLPEHQLSTASASDEDNMLFTIKSRFSELLGNELMGYWGNGSRVLITDINKHKIRNAISNATDIDNSAHKCNDILFLSLEYGVVLFNILLNEDTEMKYCPLDVEDVEALLQFGLHESEKISLVDFNHVTIHVNNACAVPVERCHGYQLFTTIGDWKPVDPELVPLVKSNLWQKLDNMLCQIKRKQKIRKKRRSFTRKKQDSAITQLLFFVGKCFLLNNMECTDRLLLGNWDSIVGDRVLDLGYRLDRKEVFICWSREQKQLVDEIMECLYCNSLQQQQLRLIIRGCFGSGKTLVLSYIIRQFLFQRNNNEKYSEDSSKSKILVIIDQEFILIRQALIKTFDQSSVVVCSPDKHSVETSSSSYGLILCDENSHKDYMKDIMEIKDTHVIILSPSSPPVQDMTFGYRLRSLGTTSQRTHHHITTLCACLSNVHPLGGFHVTTERGTHASQQTQQQCYHGNYPRLYFLNTKTKTWISEANKAYGDNSDQRGEFGTASGCYASNFVTMETNLSTTTLVCGFCRLETLKQIEETVKCEVSDERFKKLTFATVNEVRGVEFDCVVCVIDCLWDCFNVVTLEVGINRCRDTLILLINTINGAEARQSDFEQQYRLSMRIERQKELLCGIRNYQKKTLHDYDDVIPYVFPLVTSQYNDGYNSDVSD